MEQDVVANIVCYIKCLWKLHVKVPLIAEKRHVLFR